MKKNPLQKVAHTASDIDTDTDPTPTPITDTVSAPTTVPEWGKMEDGLFG